MISKAHAAGKKAEAEAMDIMGHVIVAQGNRIVKKFPNGTIEIISTIE
jgi:hypothetical protein